MLPLDLHVLSLSLAFILSQDQTLHCKILFRNFVLAGSCVHESRLSSFFDSRSLRCFVHVNILKNSSLSRLHPRPFLEAKADAKIKRFSLPFQIFFKVFSNFFRGVSLQLTFTPPRFISTTSKELRQPLSSLAPPFRFSGCKDNSIKSPFPNFFTTIFQLFYKTLENKYLKATPHAIPSLKVFPVLVFSGNFNKIASANTQVKWILHSFSYRFHFWQKNENIFSLSILDYLF